MFDINWNELTESKYNDFVKEFKTKSTVHDCIGQIRVGELCFDVIYDMNEDNYLSIDCYVYNEYDGYAGYKDGIPYAYANGVGISNFNIDTPYREFVMVTNELITEHINEAAFNVKEHANKPLLVW